MPIRNSNAADKFLSAGGALAALAPAVLLLTCRVGADEGQALRLFESRIRPVLVRHCYECHSHAAEEPKGGLRLDWRDGIREGGESGPAVVPYQPADSLLMEALRHESLEMPPEQKLPAEVIADFAKWIELGAADPRDAPPSQAAAAQQRWEETLRQRRSWWSLQPVARPPTPPAAGGGGPIDRFILSRLQQANLTLAPPADRRTLARRLHYVLLGLPPRPEEVESFVADQSPAAYERLVDRLLASPHFGERWARHWMDVVRYTDTYGYEWDIPAKGAWRYRDYLIRAFNQDVPLDQMIREQIAGDLLEQPRINDAEQINESLLGTMFFQMGEKRHGDSSEFNGIHQEMLDNKIDAFSKAFQALTISCARCHDHKRDAVSQKDYYALAGIFMSSRWVTNTLDLPRRNAQVLEELRSIKSQLQPLLAEQWLDDVQRLPEEMAEGLAAGEAASPRVARWRELTAAAAAKEPPLEDPLHAWSKLAAAAREQDADASSVWSQLAEHYADQMRQRAGDNAAHFKVLVDFSHGVPDGWSVDGVGLREATSCGDFTVALDGDALVGRLLPGGLFTHALSPRLNGAVRTPYLNQFPAGHISFEGAGGDFAAYRTVVDNAFLTEKQQYLTGPALNWKLLSTLNSMSRHVYIEVATKTSNPNFPPRVGLGGETTAEQEADPRSWFGLTRVVLHEAGRTPADDLKRFASLFASTPQDSAPADSAPKQAPLAAPQQVAQQYGAWFQSAVRAWSQGRASPDDVRLINWLLENQLLTNRRDVLVDGLAAELVRQYREVEQQIATPWTANGMADLDQGYDYRLNVRGDYDQLGEAVPRRYVEVFSLLSPALPSQLASGGSGRLELAEQVASAENPLTARVYVNRVWQWLFGQGLVDTPSDFGKLGDQPSHPQLLDYLASRFVAEGWSHKRLVHQILLSETWRQSGEVRPEARRADPKNRLLHHYPLQRLEAEAIRDGMLAAAGRLDRRLYGPPCDPYRSKEDPQKRLFCGPLDGRGRRSIYTKITIMEPPRLLATFNQPEPKIPTGKRDVTNTPAQSLTLLNDPLVVQLADDWGRELAKMRPGEAEARLRHMFHTALARPPAGDELRRWSRAVAELRKLHSDDGSDDGNAEPQLSQQVWRDVAHAIFNTKEFIYIR